MTTPTQPAIRQADPLSDFYEGQWWILELDDWAKSDHATDDQKRAVAVVHNLLRSVVASQTPQAAPPVAVDVPSDDKPKPVTFNVAPCEKCGRPTLFTVCTQCDEEAAPPVAGEVAAEPSDFDIKCVRDQLMPSVWALQAFERILALRPEAAPTCSECAKKSSEGWALYCVDCALKFAPAFDILALPTPQASALEKDAARIDEAFSNARAALLQCPDRASIRHILDTLRASIASNSGEKQA